MATWLALAFPAIGGTTSHPDPNDSASRLDVANVRMDDDQPLVRWRIATFGRWTASDIWDRGYLMVQLETKGDARVDHLAIVRSDGRRLRGTLNRVRNDGRLVEIGGIQVDKEGERAVSLWFALSRLSIGSHRTSYFWSVLTSYSSDRCPQTCFDAVPNAGMIEQPLPGASPSPTPTATPTGPSG